MVNASGFPRVDPLFKCRYWPAVQAWLDARHGLGRNAAPLVIDGEETFPASSGQSARLRRSGGGLPGQSSRF